VVNDQPISTNNETSLGGVVAFSASFRLPGIGPGNFRFVFRDSVDQPGPDARLVNIRLAATAVGSSTGGGGGSSNGPDLPPVGSLGFSGSGFASYPLQVLRPDEPGNSPAGELRNAPTAWFSVLLLDDYNRATGRYLDFDTGLSQLVSFVGGVPVPVSPDIDFLALASAFYRDNGQLLAFDAFSGRELTTALTFGAGSSLNVNLRPGEMSVADPYDRFFSSGGGVDLTRGQYFLGISQFQTLPRENFLIERLPASRLNSVLVDVRARWGARAIRLPVVAPENDLGLNPRDRTVLITLAPGEVRWFKFQALGINQFQRGWMDISTNQPRPPASPAADAIPATALLVYGPGGRLGNRVDFDSGFGDKSFLSLGAGSLEPGEVAVGDTKDFLGATVPVFSTGFSGSLDDQEYYLAVIGVTAYPEPFELAATVLFGNNWTIRTRDRYISPEEAGFDVESSGGPAGSVRLTVDSGLVPAPGGTPPNTAIDLGELNIGQINSEFGLGPDYENAAVRWFFFENVRAASIENRRYVDIWTSEVISDPLTGGDVVMAIYSPNGAMIADDNSSFSDYAALTFGAESPPRVLESDAILDGRDGVLPQGGYFIGVGSFAGLSQPPLFGQGFVVTPSARNSSDTGLVKLTVKADVITACGAADIASVGQTIGADGELTADDIILFVTWFVALDTRADIAGAGQTRGADGEWTADDIILFIADFVTPPSGCGI
jgi:hypothetical protein